MDLIRRVTDPALIHHCANVAGTDMFRRYAKLTFKECLVCGWLNFGAAERSLAEGEVVDKEVWIEPITGIGNDRCPACDDAFHRMPEGARWVLNVVTQQIELAARRAEQARQDALRHE